MHAVTGARILAVAATLLTQSVPTHGQTTAAPAASYWVYVANESSDLVSRVRFGPNGVVEEKTIQLRVGDQVIDTGCSWRQTVDTGISLSPTGGRTGLYGDSRRGQTGSLIQPP